MGVSLCQQVFSAALIGYLESRTDLDDAAKNSFTTPPPHPYTKEDMLKSATNRGEQDLVEDRRRIVEVGAKFPPLLRQSTARSPAQCDFAIHAQEHYESAVSDVCGGEGCRGNGAHS